MLLASVVLMRPAAPPVGGLIKEFCAWLAKKQPRNEAVSVRFFQIKQGVFENAQHKQIFGKSRNYSKFHLVFPLYVVLFNNKTLNKPLIYAS